MTQEEINEIRRKEQARYSREWRKKNPQKAKAIKERYWAKKAAAIKSEAMKEAYPEKSTQHNDSLD